MGKINTKVDYVKPNSIAEELGIEKGDIVLSVNENELTDILEYKFLTNEDYVVILVRKPDGEEWELEIEKDYDEDIGIVFENSLLDDAKSCKNKCIFCFIDQLPKNMRETLYFKDDDSRLSFLQGNYVTLTNLNDFDIEKIIRYRISPLNVSIHTTEPDLRVKMLNNRFAGNIMSVLKRLSNNGIELNGQIVVCPDVNDKKHLDRTIEDLSKLLPSLCSVSVVPVGLTKHRAGLPDLKSFDKESSIDLINQVEEWQKGFKKRFKTNLVYIADEFYIMAQKDIPAYKEYEDFPQIENGVGLIALFKKQFDDYLKSLVKSKYLISENRTVSLVTGTSSYEFIKDLCGSLEKKFSNLKINLYCIKNNFFGESVTVTGLITGTDIIEQLEGKELGIELIIPKCMLRHNTDILLDDVSTKDLCNKLKVNVSISEIDGKDFIKNIIGRC